MESDQLQTPSKAASSSAVDPPKSPQGYTLENGFHISKSAVQAVDAQITPAVTAFHEEVIDWDYENWKRLHPEHLPQETTEDSDDDDEELEREAEKEVEGFYEWCKHR